MFIEEVWRRRKEDILAAAEKGIGRKKDGEVSGIVVRRDRKTY